MTMFILGAVSVVSIEILFIFGMSVWLAVKQIKMKEEKKM